MISIKPGAKIKGIQPEILLGLMVIHSVFEHFHYSCVVTEATGSVHMENSLHYKGYALDIRTNHISNLATKNEITRRCAETLGEDFDVILECQGQASEHLHVEFDPK